MTVRVAHAPHGRSGLLVRGVRTIAVAAMLLLLGGCIPIGVRVQNMLGAALG